MDALQELGRSGAVIYMYTYNSSQPLEGATRQASAPFESTSSLFPSISAHRGGLRRVGEPGSPTLRHRRATSPRLTVDGKGG